MVRNVDVCDVDVVNTVIKKVDVQRLNDGNV